MIALFSRKVAQAQKPTQAQLDPSALKVVEALEEEETRYVQAWVAKQEARMDRKKDVFRMDNIDKKDEKAKYAEAQIAKQEALMNEKMDGNTMADITKEELDEKVDMKIMEMEEPGPQCDNEESLRAFEGVDRPKH